MIVFDNKQNIYITAEKPKLYKGGPVNSWYIITEKLEYKYFNRQDVANSILRKKISSRPKDVINQRNNVEASIFQLCYHLSGKKSHYRGLIKHRLWAFARCLWVNFVRIIKYLKNGTLKPIIEAKKMVFFYQFLYFYVNLSNYGRNLFFIKKSVNVLIPYSIFQN